VFYQVFNTTSQTNSTKVSNNNNLRINAITGTILKNHPLSWIESFHLGSKRAEELFANQAVTGKRCYKATRLERDVGKFEHDYNLGFRTKSQTDYEYEEFEEKPHTIILQMMMCGDKEVIAELVKKEDYDNSFMIDNKKG
jgi:hypothetical protein